MNERYLFRGKRIDNEEWATGDFSRRDSRFAPQLNTTYGISDNYGVFTTVDPATVGQCTGLRDKNGTLIFEGDIVRKEMRKNDYYDCEIIWNHCEFGRSGIHGYHPIHQLEIEVIGNIHDKEAQNNEMPILPG